MIFDHVDLRVSDVGRVRTFYDAFLRPFGFRGRPQDDGTLLYFDRVGLIAVASTLLSCDPSGSMKRA